jgi:micrococcal nuclease
MKPLFLFFLFLVAFSSFATSKVIRVIDGDTFETENGERVRLIGINAPEISDIFGVEAKQHLIELVEGKNVDLVPDKISNDRDVYGRQLRYVYCNNSDINRLMVSDGYAFAYLKYSFEKADEYKSAQLEAQHNNVGIWNNQQKEKITDSQNVTKGKLWERLSIKTYLLSGLLLILIIGGLYYYYKK